MPESLVNRKVEIKTAIFKPDVRHALIISCSNYSTGPFNIETGKAYSNDQPENEDYAKTIEFFLKRYGFYTTWLQNPNQEDINSYMKKITNEAA